jgi:RsiW-degrading membrane proteinase PrsW (M82 family)
VILEPGLIVRALLGLLPVVCFLAALVALDSYKLVRLRTILSVIALGGLAAGVSYVINMLAYDGFDLGFATLSRYVAPLIEEAMKGAVILMLLRTHRIGFLVDAAIFGVAVGAGFAMVENLFYLQSLADAHVGVWIVRGFGTAVMHGGVQAIFAVMLVAISDRRGRTDLNALVPALLAAAVIHSIFNHFVWPPLYQTLAQMMALPPLMWAVFRSSEKAVEGWLGAGFDADAELLELINSGRFGGSPVGNYLEQLRSRFRGEVVADLLCYLRLHVELALRAKGVLMMREGGFEVEVDEPTRAKFEEMSYLERSVGPTALLAMKPFLHMSRKDLWQLYMLGK